MVAAGFRLLHLVPTKFNAVYVGNGFDLAGAKLQDPDAITLPLPATYVIDRDATARFASVSADDTKRAGPDHVLDAARALT